MANPLNPHTMTRLAFIRLLHQQGVEQSRLPEPLVFTAVLSFHDAVEHFLILAGEQLGATLSDRIQFMQYWGDLSPKKLSTGVELSSKVAMDRLNRLRNGFKHAGTMPSLAAVEQARAEVATFFEDNTPKVFGIAYDGIDMADLIPQEEARLKVKDAVAANDAGDRITAMGLLLLAFRKLFGSHVDANWFTSSPFSFGRDLLRPMDEHKIVPILRQHNPHDHRGPKGQATTNSSSNWGVTDLAKQIATITETTTLLQRALRITSIGIEYHQYHRFQQLTPRIGYRGNAPDAPVFDHSDDYAPSMAEFEYCQQFVITVALRLTEIQAQTVPPSWKRPT